jgi:hypothetical protein
MIWHGWMGKRVIGALSVPKFERRGLGICGREGGVWRCCRCDAVRDGGQLGARDDLNVLLCAIYNVDSHLFSHDICVPILFARS